MPRFFVPAKNIRGGQGFLEGPELVHLRRVLRLKAGDHIIVFSAADQEHEAVIAQLSEERCEFEILRSWRAATESSFRVTLAVGLTKGDKMDFVVEKATELGAQAIVPFASEFSVPRLDESKVAARIARWNKIALSAVKQCGRTHPPEIYSLSSFDALMKAEWNDSLKLFFWERERAQSLQAMREKSKQAQAALIVIGPEGGFSDGETGLAENHGFERVHLGPRILRAETAAIVALSLVQFLWGDGS
jgi:16S rRNA (uracil1498-N3)-methyltransferase